MVLNRQHRRTAPSINLLIGQTNSSQEMQRTIILGQLKGGQVDRGWAEMVDERLTFRRTEINVEENGLATEGPAQVSPAQVSPAHIGLAQVGSTQISIVQISIT